jgi:ElaB/YqjD/DUF883 family membrane-anchored ribosome-binding protein
MELVAENAQTLTLIKSMVSSLENILAAKVQVAKDELQNLRTQNEKLVRGYRTQSRTAQTIAQHAAGPKEFSNS